MRLALLSSFFILYSKALSVPITSKFKHQAEFVEPEYIYFELSFVSRSSLHDQRRGYIVEVAAWLA